MSAAMAAMAMIGLRLGLGLGLGLGGMLGSAAALMLHRRASAIALDRAAQEAIDESGTLLSAARKGIAYAAMATVCTLAPLLFIRTLGLASFTSTRVLLAGAIMPVLVARATNLVAVEPQPIERFE